MAENTKTDELREEVLSLVHIVGCQAQSNGFNSKNAKDVDLAWVEKAEENLTDELLQLINSEVHQALDRLSSNLVQDISQDPAFKAERSKYPLNNEGEKDA